VDAGPCSPRTPPPPEPLDPGKEGDSLGNVHRGDSRLPFVNEFSGPGLILAFFPQLHHFTGDTVLQLVEPGLYRKSGPKASKETGPDRAAVLQELDP